MSDLIAPAYAPQSGKASTPPAGERSGQASDSLTFRELLASLNPLQHIPVIGPIYRAVTGDVIPEAARRIGSFAVSGLMGGPIGLLTNLALLAIEKATGIDPEKIGEGILASLGLSAHDTTAVVSSEAPDWDGAPALRSDPGELAPPSAWSPLQLLAYGVTTDSAGNLRRGDLQGSDVLNDLAMVRYA